MWSRSTILAGGAWLGEGANRGAVVNLVYVARMWARSTIVAGGRTGRGGRHISRGGRRGAAEDA